MMNSSQELGSSEVNIENLASPPMGEFELRRMANIEDIKRRKAELFN